MEVAMRKKRSSASASTGLGAHGTAGGSSAYGSLTGPSGLSSGATRRSFGGSHARLSTTLSLYNDAPQEEVTLDQFERAGVDRLQALKQMETIRIRKHGPAGKLGNDPTESPISAVLTKYNLDHREWDNLSHFVLRLAYCRTEELRRWLITQEALLFKYRFDSEKEENISEFLLANDLQYVPLTIDELNTPMPRDGGRGGGAAEEDEEDAYGMARAPLLKELLKQVPFADAQSLIYYKVPFEDAIDLLRERKVYLAAGFAYVSRANLSAIITTKFRARLSQHLGMTCRATSQMKQDPRIVPLLGMLGKSYITPMYKAGKIEGAVTKEQLPALADRSFPLCMNSLYGHLKADNHLKHGGRMQLGLFLKGIGLSLADALAFWKASFARKTAPDKFDKEYAYNIRHNYGKEGKRTTYTPYGCMKIIMGAVNSEDKHGCPFKLWKEDSLRAKMRLKHIAPAHAEEIIALVKGDHYQIACQRWYAATHPGGSTDNVGNHPNAYFDMSENYWRDQEAGTTTSAAGSSSASGSGVYNGIPSSSAPSSSAAATPSSTPASSAATAPASTPASSAATAPAATPESSESGPAPMDIIDPTDAAASS